MQTPTKKNIEPQHNAVAGQHTNQIMKTTTSMHLFTASNNYSSKCQKHNAYVQR